MNILDMKLFKVPKPKPELMGLDDFDKREANEAIREHISFNDVLDLLDANLFVQKRLNITDGLGSRTAKKRLSNYIAKNYPKKHSEYYQKEKTKSTAAHIVLNLMDNDYSYEQALKIALQRFPSVSKKSLENELNQYI